MNRGPLHCPHAWLRLRCARRPYSTGVCMALAGWGDALFLGTKTGSVFCVDARGAAIHAPGAVQLHTHAVIALALVDYGAGPTLLSAGADSTATASVLQGDGRGLPSVDPERSLRLLGHSAAVLCVGAVPGALLTGSADGSARV